MTRMKKWLSLLLAGSLVTMSLTACGSSSSSSDSSDDAEEETVEEAEEEETEEAAEEESSDDDSSSSGTSFKIGYNYYGVGSYALDTLADHELTVIEAFGNEALGLSDDFQVDKIVQDIENMIASGCDGIVIWLPADNLYSTVIDLCTDAGVAFVFADKIPTDEDLLAELADNPYYAGSVGPANEIYGTLSAEYALEQGWLTCVISTGSEGDPTDTPRIEAFTEVYEAGGGTILQTVHTDSNDNIQPYTENALLAYPETQVVYGTGSDMGIGSVGAVQNQGIDCGVITAGLDSEAVALVESGDIDYIIGDFWISGTMATVALQNFLEGNPITDENGDIVYIDWIEPFEMTADDVELFTEVFINNEYYSDDEIRAMSGITYDEFVEIIENYSLDERAAAQQ